MGRKRERGREREKIEREKIFSFSIEKEKERGGEFVFFVQVFFSVVVIEVVFFLSLFCRYRRFLLHEIKRDSPNEQGMWVGIHNAFY